MMTDPHYFAEKAQRCRELLQVAIAPEVREQLRLWAEEFDEQAKALATAAGSGHGADI